MGAFLLLSLWVLVDYVGAESCVLGAQPQHHTVFWSDPMICLFTSIGGITWPELRALWQHLEETGWDAACVTDHFMPTSPTAGHWSADGAGRPRLTTERMRIGTLVWGTPIVIQLWWAKMATNVDIASGGRLICVSGLLAEEQHVAWYSVFTVGERLSRLEEARQIPRMWTEPKTTFQGHFYQLQEAPLYPKPVQKPHPELLVGGGGEKRTLRIAAKYADHWNCWAGPETMKRKIQVLKEHCAAIGRDPATIVRSANMPLLSAITRSERAANRECHRRYGWPEPTSAICSWLGVCRKCNKLGQLQDVGIDQCSSPPSCHPDPGGAGSVDHDVAPAFR
jgi:alkanesulfonate monooxygenase SsuD/methylene tetrahydromethanopterin reductase-like flavin-dependent oxidoreductase (luciferase family)